MSDVPMTPYPSESMSDVEYAASKIDQVRIATGHRGLCFRCRHGFVTQRSRDLEPQVICTSIGKPMPPDISSCSRFLASGQLTIFELIQMCDPTDILSKQRVGFKPE